MKVNISKKKAIQIIYWVLVVFLVFTSFSIVFSRFSIPGNYKIMTVLSGSMEPAIKTGSLVVIKPKEEYRIGEVITFQFKGKNPITHRIVDIEIVDGKPQYITKGDANKSPDARKVKKEEVIGRVLFSIPYLGYLVEGVKKPVGFLIVVIVPAVVIIFDELRKIYKELKHKKYD